MRRANPQQDGARPPRSRLRSADGPDGTFDAPLRGSRAWPGQLMRQLLAQERFPEFVELDLARAPSSAAQARIERPETSWQNLPNDRICAKRRFRRVSQLANHRIHGQVANKRQ